jgi:hypothetical protein
MNATEVRAARCVYCKTVSTREALPFWEDRGPGSKWALEGCVHCGYSIVAHEPAAQVWKNGKTAVENRGCPGFEARGPHEFDAFYCGCRGWD